MIRELASRLKGRVLILGIGNELRGDDGAGAFLAESLRGRVRAAVINGGETPESWTGMVKEQHAETIIFVDAVDMGREPGAVSLVSREDLKDLPVPSTHDVPLRLLADYLREETGAEVFLLAIQAKTTAFGAGLSPEVNKSLSSLKEIFLELMGSDPEHDR